MDKLHSEDARNRQCSRVGLPMSMSMPMFMSAPVERAQGAADSCARASKFSMRLCGGADCTGTHGHGQAGTCNTNTNSTGGVMHEMPSQCPYLTASGCKNPGFVLHRR